jgi:hypothetical protein
MGQDLYVEQVVDSEVFINAAFQTEDQPFLPEKVLTAGVPFVNVLLSPDTT